ncbi:MAG: hypothetical protein IJ449_01310, partial [Clostridia bacterium]|nr:hypothetical protein [Clostridia bacterium]
TDASFFFQIALFHIFINKHLPEFVIADTHNGSPPCTKSPHIFIISQKYENFYPFCKFNICERKLNFAIENI